MYVFMHVGSLGFTCLPYQSSALESPPSWSPYTPLHIWLHTYFHGFVFPIKQKPCTSSSGQPVSEVLWNVTQTPWEHRKGRLPASVWSTVFAGSLFFGAEIHGCISVPLNEYLTNFKRKCDIMNA